MPEMFGSGTYCFWQRVIQCDKNAIHGKNISATESPRLTATSGPLDLWRNIRAIFVEGGVIPDAGGENLIELALKDDEEGKISIRGFGCADYRELRISLLQYRLTGYVFSLSRKRERGGNVQG